MKCVRIMLLLAAALVCATGTGEAQRAEPLPDALEGVGITEHPGAALPLSLEFRDETGRTVRLGDYFKGDRPLILTLNYYGCEMLCTLQLNGLVEALKQMPGSPGQEFEIVTVSINPLETPTLARLKKQNYIREYGRPSAAGGWHFLVGREAEIRTLTDTVGFGYRYDKERQQYAHAAALFVCSPKGILSRCLYGIQYEPQTVRLALSEASEGKTGSTLDRVLLYCFHFDEASGRYAPTALSLMRAGGGLTLLLLGTGLGALWLREVRRRRRAGPVAASGSAAP